MPSPTALRQPWLAGALGLVAVAIPSLAWSQAAEPAAPAAPGAPPRSMAVTAGLTLEAATLDVRNRPVAGNGIEFTSRLSPTLTLAHIGGRVRGTLIYSGALGTRRGISDREDTDYTNALSASYVLEAIEGIGFVDARASITQQTLSAVGTPAGASGSADNRTEVRSLTLSPYLRGALGGMAEYELRGAGTVTRGADGAAGNADSALATFYFRSPRSAAVVGWGLSGSRQKVKFATASSATTTDRLGVELSFRPDIDWRFSLTGGQERTDVVGALQQTYENYGAAIEWTPSPRTTFSVQGEERYFGRAHRVGVEHRLQRSVFRYTDSRDVRSGADPLGAGQAITLYELYFSQYAQQFPDPVQRDQFVLALIQALGRSRDEVVSGGLFTTAGIVVQRRRDLTWTWSGPRLSLSASGFTLDSERADTGGFTPAGINDNVAQTGYAGSIGWRLTPLMSITASGSRAMSKDVITFERSDLKSASLGLAGRLGVRTTGLLGARYSVLNGSRDGYRETAVTASISLRF